MEWKGWKIFRGRGAALGYSLCPGPFRCGGGVSVVLLLPPCAGQGLAQPDGVPPWAQQLLGMVVEWEAFPEGAVNPSLNMTLFYHQIRQQMEEQVAQKSSELEQYLQRVRELEDMYLKLQEALEDERQARQDEETVRKLQARCQISLYIVPLRMG